jgi:hypothetical protein
MGVRTGVGAVAALWLVASSCSRGGDATPVVADAAAASSMPEVMRSVPTLPPETTIVAEDSSTIAAAPVDPNAPIVTVAPPTTDLIGDPQPSPNATRSAAPISDGAAPLPDACTRLASFGIEQIVVERSGQVAQSELTPDGACRITSGDLVTEIAFVSLDAFRTDWSRRDGIEPVGDVGGEAVGLASFQTPSGGSGAGFTIAIAGGDEGVVVAVSAPSDARLLAAKVAVLSQQAG